jgi:hypothetical protein
MSLTGRKATTEIGNTDYCWQLKEEAPDSKWQMFLNVFNVYK